MPADTYDAAEVLIKANPFVEKGYYASDMLSELTEANEETMPGRKSQTAENLK